VKKRNLKEFEPYLVKNCCFLKSLKKPFTGTIWNPQKAFERAYFAEKRPKIHQSKNPLLSAGIHISLTRLKLTFDDTPSDSFRTGTHQRLPPLSLRLPRDIYINPCKK